MLIMASTNNCCCPSMTRQGRKSAQARRGRFFGNSCIDLRKDDTQVVPAHTSKTATLLISSNDQPRVLHCRFSGTKLPPPAANQPPATVSKSINIAERKKSDQPANKIARLLAKVRRSSHSSSSSSSISKSPCQTATIPPNDGHTKHLERQNCIRDSSDVDLEAGLGTNSTGMLTAIDPTFGGKLTPPPLAVRAEIEALNAELQRQSFGHISPTQLSPKKKRSIVAETVPEESSLSIITDEPPHATIERLSSSSGTTTDSALSSTNDSRRNSSGTGFFSNGGNGPAETGFIRPRRSTVTGKLPPTRINKAPLLGTLPNGQSPQMMAGAVGWRTVSVDSQFDNENFSDEEMSIDMRSIQRRMSVDEKTLRNANYAILRKSDNCFQVVGAFNRHETTAYRNYLQAMTAYDLLPAHGIVLMICSKLSIRKTIHALCSQSSTKAAITTESETGDYNIFTISDALHCLQLRRKDKSVADQTVQQYFEAHQTQKRLVVTGEITSVWDVARMFRMNHVHRIPVVRVENFVRTKEVMGVCSLRPIFVEVMKMFEKSHSLSPNLHHLTLASTGLGKRKNLATINENASCADAVDRFLDGKISCIPLVNSEDNIVGALTKSDIMSAIAVRGEGAIDEIMDSPVNTIANPMNFTEMLISADQSLASAIRQLVANHHQCLLIAHKNKLLGVLSYADIMDFLVDR